MEISIRHNLREVRSWLGRVEREQLPFATALAMTWTAQEVRTEEISVMKRVFNNPTPYALNALRVSPATKRSLIASVEFKDFSAKSVPAKRFLNPGIHGGPRSRKSHEKKLEPFMRGYNATVPAGTLKRNAYGNVPGPTYKRILSHLGASSDSTQNITGSKGSKAKRANSQYFVPARGSKLRAGVWERYSVAPKGKRKKGAKKPRDKIRPALIFVSLPRYRKRFPFFETAHSMIRRRFNANFARAFERAMATAKPPR